MDNTVFVSVLKTIEVRMRECQRIGKPDFDECLHETFVGKDEVELYHLIRLLFEEHTLLTSLINDVNDLRSSLSKFDL